MMMARDEASASRDSDDADDERSLWHWQTDLMTDWMPVKTLTGANDGSDGPN